MNNSNIKYIFFYVFSLTFIFIYPIASIFFSLIVFYKNVNKNNNFISYFLIVTSITLFYVSINIHREIFTRGNDLLWYVYYWKIFPDYNNGFLNIFNSDLYTIAPKSSEPIYHLITYFLSKLFDGYYPIYVLWVHLIIYLTPSVIIFKICKSRNVPDLIIFTIIVFQMLMFYDFSNTYNIVRQHVCMSFLMIAFYFSLNKKVFYCALWCIISILTHNSSVIISAVIFLLAINRSVWFINNKSILIFTIFLSVCFVYVYNALMPNYEYLDDQGRGAFVKLLELLIFAFSIFIVNFISNKYYDLWMFYFLIVVIVIISHMSVFLPLRFFTYLDAFKWIAWLIIFEVLNLNSKSNRKILICLIFVPVIYLSLKIYVSTVTFNIDIKNYLLSSPYEYIINDDLRM
jgi:hypothetical protein